MKNAIIIFLVTFALLVLLTGSWEVVSKTVLPDETWGLYSEPFFRDLITSLHGNLLDLFVIGIVLYWLEQRRIKRESASAEIVERNSAIARAKETLEDLRFYKGDDASFRTLAAIKRLLDLNCQQIVCPDASLKHIEIKRMNLSRAKLPGGTFIGSRIDNVVLDQAVLDGSNFSEAKITNTSFTGGTLNRAKFIGTTLNGADFRDCRVERASFQGARLKSANFSGVDCRGVNFDDCDLTQANFIGAKNLPANFPVNARRSKNIKLQQYEK